VKRLIYREILPEGCPRGHKGGSHSFLSESAPENRRMSGYRESRIKSSGFQRILPLDNSSNINHVSI